MDDTQFLEFLESEPRLANELLDELSQRDRMVVSLRFSLNGNPNRTLEEVAVKMGLTRERVRTICGEALEKARALLELELELRKPMVRLGNRSRLSGLAERAVA